MQCVKFDINEQDTLLCPKCDGDYLHHGKVEIFDRNEDAIYGLYTIVSSRKIQSENCALVGNPSMRRDGIKIHFYCEHCQADLTLAIAQHKGQTLIKWI